VAEKDEPACPVGVRSRLSDPFPGGDSGNHQATKEPTALESGWGLEPQKRRSRNGCGGVRIHAADFPTRSRQLERNALGPQPFLLWGSFEESIGWQADEIARRTITQEEELLNRKRLLSHTCLTILAMLAVALVPLRTARATITSAPQYRLRLYHTHTNEHIDIVYRAGDNYIPEAIEQLEHFLRDHRTGAVHHFDPRLFDELVDLTAAVGRPQAEINVVCGYRTPWSNAFLRSRSSAVAEHSLHMQAMAIDIRLPGTSTAVLRDAALALHRGGVGYYRSSDFIHVDVGRVRRW
jgi:uncharacterized protein YcbK (DUF882 family)